MAQGGGENMWNSLSRAKGSDVSLTSSSITEEWQVGKKWVSVSGYELRGAGAQCLHLSRSHNCWVNSSGLQMCVNKRGDGRKVTLWILLIGTFSFRWIRLSSQLGGPKPFLGRRGISMKSMDHTSQKKQRRGIHPSLGKVREPLKPILWGSG